MSRGGLPNCVSAVRFAVRACFQMDHARATITMMTLADDDVNVMLARVVVRSGCLYTLMSYALLYNIHAQHRHKPHARKTCALGDDVVAYGKWKAIVFFSFRIMSSATRRCRTVQHTFISALCVCWLYIYLITVCMIVWVFSRSGFMFELLPCGTPLASMHRTGLYLDSFLITR